MILVVVVALTAIGILMVYSSSALQGLPVAGRRHVRDGRAADPVGDPRPGRDGRHDARRLPLPAPRVGAARTSSRSCCWSWSSCPRLNIEVGGSARWLKLGRCCRRSTRPSSRSSRWSSISPTGSPSAARGVRGFWRGTVPFLLIVAPVIALVFKEPDLGTTGVITLTAFTMFFVAGANLVHLAAMGSAAVVGDRRAVGLRRLPAGPGPGLARTRGSDPLGRWLPHRPGPARPRRRRAVRDGPRQSSRRCSCPNAFNDFIFAEIGQEFGLVGGGRRHRPVPGPGLSGHPRRARRRRTRSGRCWRPGSPPGCASRRSSTSAVVVALLPITGITLPFISAGGSSLIISFAAVGILLSISRETVGQGDVERRCDC